MKQAHHEITNLYPFLSCIKNEAGTFFGIIQNIDKKTISFYNYNKIRKEDKKKFLKLGEIWWNESNREIPINIFLEGKLSEFNYALQIFARKKTEIAFGPTTSLLSLLSKKGKRKRIQLIRLPPL